MVVGWYIVCVVVIRCFDWFLLILRWVVIGEEVFFYFIKPSGGEACFSRTYRREVEYG